VVESVWVVRTEADSEAATELDLEADMEVHTEPELATVVVTVVAMVVATVEITVALMGVTIVAAQLAGRLAGLPVGLQALVAEVQVAEVQVAVGTASTRHRLCLMLAVGVITPRRQRTGMWDVEQVSLESCKCQSRLGQTIAVASSFPSCFSCCSRCCTTSCRRLPPLCLPPFLRRR